MYTRGLKGVVAVETRISSVDGENGVLRYRGKTIEEVVHGGTFESVAAFLWGVEKEDVEFSLREGRQLGTARIDFLRQVPREVSLMDQVRTVMSTLGTPTFLQKSLAEQAMLLTGAIPVITAAAYRMTKGRAPVAPDPELPYVANYLYMITGKKPTETSAKALETYLITTMEHGMNASTFAARVTVSSESDLPSGLVSALGTMKGPLHGGAPSGVLALLDEIQEVGSVEAVIQKKLETGERIMGFGHRVYKTEDPRSLVLRYACERLGAEEAWLALAVKAEAEIIRLLDQYKPGRRLYTNVEYYAAAIMKSIDMSPELFTPTFSVARTVGWTAHMVEQLKENMIFRPESVYIED
ncbi:citrate/2-methylcitrate synthase [Chryseomicrobium palamuruense]|uniref:Citrate synthase n=1 Tax=Chryseomicrobium palamuruense TaxID=682973 RepID=A0ABV8UWI7_9BACL